MVSDLKLSNVITAVFFDLGLTLAHSSRDGVITTVLQEQGHQLERAQVQAGIYCTNKYFMREYPGLLGQDPDVFYEDYLGYLFDTLGVNADPVQVKAEVFHRDPPRSRWHVYPETEDVLKRLQAHGYRLGVISNWDPSGPEVLKQLGLTGYFDIALFSEIEGVAKPDPEIFLRALGQTGIEPANALYVGDNYHDDAVGARAAGMSFLLIDRLPDVEVEEEWDCTTIHDLWGVMQCLGHLGAGTYTRMEKTGN